MPAIGQKRTSDINMKLLRRDSPSYKRPRLLDYLWIASGICLLALLVPMWAGYRNQFGIASTALAFSALTTAMLVRHWSRRAPLRRYGAVIAPCAAPRWCAFHC